MALPYPTTIRMPAGDSRTLRFKQPYDYLTGESIDPATYDAIAFGLSPEGSDTATVTKSLGAGVAIEGGTSDILVDLTASDTETVGPGRYTLQVRLSQGGTVRHTLQPLHILELVASPL
jgi:hypothetical protein